jgi:hypothetical protein
MASPKRDEAKPGRLMLELWWSVPDQLLRFPPWPGDSDGRLSALVSKGLLCLIGCGSAKCRATECGATA